MMISCSRLSLRTAILTGNQSLSSSGQYLYFKRAHDRFACSNRYSRSNEDLVSYFQVFYAYRFTLWGKGSIGGRIIEVKWEHQPDELGLLPQFHCKLSILFRWYPLCSASIVPFRITHPSPGTLLCLAAPRPGVP